MGKVLVKEIIKKYDRDSGMLIPMLQDIQAEHGYLPPDQLKMLSKNLEIPLSRIYSVATFYSSFRMAPKGQHEVTLCMGTVCYLKGADRISETICREFKVEPGGTTPDRLFSYQPVNCVGACALAPVMIVDGEYYDGVSPESVMNILNGLSSDDEETAPLQEKKSVSKAETATKRAVKPKPKKAVKKAASKPQAKKKPPVGNAVNEKAPTGQAAAQKTVVQKAGKKVGPETDPGMKEGSS